MLDENIAVIDTETTWSNKFTHNFFGLLYYTPNNDGEGVVHPSSPQN